MYSVYLQNSTDLWAFLKSCSFTIIRQCINVSLYTIDNTVSAIAELGLLVTFCFGSLVAGEFSCLEIRDLWYKKQSTKFSGHLRTISFRPLLRPDVLVKQKITEIIAYWYCSRIIRRTSTKRTYDGDN